MKMNRSNILTIVITLVVGISAGAFFFGGKNESSELMMTSHDHSDETGVWTCSMHPQVRQNEAGSCPFCGMDLVPVSENAETSPRELRLTESAIALANIQTSKVQSASTNQGLSLNGKLTYDERATHSQTTHFGGRIERLYKNYEGEAIQKGEIIARIYSPELVAAQEELLQAKKVQESNPLLLASARRKLKYWKLTDQQIADIEQSEKPIEQFPLLAQFNGIISKKHVNNGDHVMEGQALMEISDPKKLWAVFEVYEKDINKIDVGNQVEFEVNGSMNKFNALLSFISPQVDPSSRIIEVRADVNNVRGELKSQMFIDGEISTDARGREAITIPKSAVLWTGKRSIVYVKHPGDLIFELREIEIRPGNGDQFEVLSGLDAGEEIVTNGTFTLDAEAQLQGKISMMNTSSAQVESTEVFSEIELTEVKDYSTETPNAFKAQLLEFTMSYIELKDAMVEGEANSITSKATLTKDALDKINMSLVKGEAHVHWMELLNALNNSLEKITSSIDRDEQRLEFINLSKASINAIESFGSTNDQPLYIQFCPMANDDKGANWISLNENIINPYFGDMMLTCGSLTKTINN